jgi:carotenoid cleavage dioxygenase-like enzyme
MSSPWIEDPIMDRRHFLASLGAAGVLTPEIAQAAAQGAMAAAAGIDWRPAFADFEVDLARAPMTLVSGRAPDGLSGALYRNGPGKFHRPGGSVGHWFDGDGLVRAFRFGGGQATLQARFVDTPKRRRDAASNAVVTPGFGTAAGPGSQMRHSDDVNAANISVMMAGRELWALWEGGSPIALDPADLSTREIKTLRPDLAHMPFLAHPRREPGGEVWSLGVSGLKAIVWRLAADGALKTAQVIDIPAASYVHDFVITPTRLVIILQPWLQDRFVTPVVDSYSWRPEQGTKVLVLDKADLGRRRIHELPPFFAFHFGDAWEERDGTIRFAACVSDDPYFAQENGRALMKGQWKRQASPKLAGVVLRPGGGAALETSGMDAEFPRADERFAGLKRRWLAHGAIAVDDVPMFQGLGVTDLETGRSRVFDFGAGQLVEEAVFAPRPGSSGEMDGWLLTPSVNIRARATELAVFDAQRVDAGPVCVWRAEGVLPVSLHGVFVAA